MECGEEVSCGLLIARGDAPEVFDRVEKTLHQVALPVEGKVAVPLDDAIFFGRDHGRDGADLQAREEGIAVVTFVGEHRAGPDLSGQGFGLGDVMHLPAGKAQGDGKPERVDDGMNFGRKTTARATYGLVETPFLRAPALC